MRDEGIDGGKMIVIVCGRFDGGVKGGVAVHVADVGIGSGFEQTFGCIFRASHSGAVQGSLIQERLLRVGVCSASKQLFQVFDRVAFGCFVQRGKAVVVEGVGYVIVLGHRG